LLCEVYMFLELSEYIKFYSAKVAALF